jgi:Ca2+-binding RTX toxin-like protein
MAIKLLYPTSKNDPELLGGYIWVGDTNPNPAYDNKYDPFATSSYIAGNDPFSNNYAGFQFLPKNLDTTGPGYLASFMTDINDVKFLGPGQGSDSLRSSKDWNHNPPASVSVDQNNVNLALAQWNHVIDLSTTDKTISFAYVSGTNLPEDVSGVTYVGANTRVNQYVIFFNDNLRQTTSLLNVNTGNLSLGTWGGWTTMHELGHVFDLYHNGVLDDLRMSIMTYPNVKNSNGGFDHDLIPLTPGMDDIANAQTHYGQSKAQDGDTNYIFGQASVDLGHGNVLANVYGNVPANTYGTGTQINLNRYVMTLWDRPTGDGGIDTIDASALTTKVYINLNPGHFSAIGTDVTLTASQIQNGVTDAEEKASTDFNVGIARLAQIENAKGGSGNDYLKGNDLANTLEGNNGNDTLEGGKGSDTLKGGSGFDTYIFKGATYGIDTIEDSGGGGSIQIDNQTALSGGDFKFESIFKNESTGYTYVKVNGGVDLLVLKENDPNRIIIKNWSISNSLGLTLNDVTLATPTATLEGDYKKLVDDRGTTDKSDDYYSLDLFGNYTKDGNALDIGALDLLNGTDNNDVINSKGGDDAISGKNGDDYLMGDTGGDFIQGGLGADTIFGGDGSDVIYGSSNSLMNLPQYGELKAAVNLTINPLASGLTWYSGYSDLMPNDAPNIFLFAKNVNSWWGGHFPLLRVAGDAGNMIDGGKGGDWIGAGSGDDYVIGGEGDDLIFGLDGADILLGGLDNDVIHGDGYTLLGDFWNYVAPENHGNDIIDGGDGNDLLFGQGKDDIIFGGKGNDVIYGDDDEDSNLVGNDILYGGANNDQLFGGALDDTLTGGSGNDTLNGGAGKDTYIFNRGDGIDSVIDTIGDSNIFVFGEGINKNDIKLRLGSLLLDLGYGDQIHIQNFDKNNIFNSSSINSFQFADGTSLSMNALLARGFDLDGTNANDVINGTNTIDRILGLAGNDTLYGKDGNDVLDGGTGNDMLVGGNGNDTYVFGSGFGFDTVDNIDDDLSTVDEDTILLNNVNQTDVTFNRSPDNDLFIQINATGEKLSVLNYFNGNEVRNIKFNDGSSWDSIAFSSSFMLATSGNDTLLGNASNNIINGGLGRDQIYGYSGNDTLDGGSSDIDYLYGGAGADTYLFGRGSGLDTMNEFASDKYGNLIINTDVDTIQLGAGILTSDVSFRHTYNTGLILKINGTNDELTMGGFFYTRGINYNYDNNVFNFAIEQIKFIDGTILDIATVKALALLGTPGDDDIYDYETNDTLNGLSGGNDTMTGGNGADTYLFGIGSGQDVVYNTDYGSGLGFGRSIAQADTIQIIGGITSSSLKFERDFNDNLKVSINGANDTLTVRSYFYSGSASSPMGTGVFIKLTDGTIFDFTSVKAIVLLPTPGDDFIKGDVINDTLNGAAGNDSIYGMEGADILFGGTGNDSLEGGSGDDSLQGQDGNDYLIGQEGNDTLLGGAGNDNLNDYIGDDVLDGGAGNDTITAGYGSDIYVFGRGYDQDIIDNYHDSVLNPDVLNLGTGIVASDLTLTRFIDSLVLRVTGTNDVLTIGNYFVEGSQLDFIKFQDGTSWDVATVATKLSPYSEGDDYIAGTVGADSLIGGLGNDIYVVNNVGDIVVEQVNAGIDSVESSITYTLAANLENLTLTGSLNINGTGNTSDNVIYGNYSVNVLTGLAGNDTLDGGGVATGADTLVGGLGSDKYYYSIGYGNLVIDNTATDNSTAIDTLYINYYDALLPEVLLTRVVNDLLISANATDKITVKNYFATGDNKIDQIIFYDANLGVATLTWNQSAIQAHIVSVPTAGDDFLNGTAGNDIIDALAGNDTVYGLAGNDSLIGGIGNDTLDGGIGIDTLIGGLGNDTYIIDDALDIVTETSTLATEIDIVEASTNFVLSVNLEKLTLTGTTNINATGNGLANTLIGNAGNNVLNGLVGADTMIGGLGNDIYTIDATTDVITENLNEGADTVNVAIATAAGTYTVAANLENATLTNTVAYNLTGNGFDNILTGNAANNILNGLVGNDSMLGGLGNDTYTIDVLTDIITENLNEGADLVNVAIATAAGTYTVAANVENATLTNTVVYNLTGNALANTLIGNAAANIIDGGLGADSMTGGLGNDTYTVDDALDVVTEASTLATEIDSVLASVNYVLGANLEKLTLTGTTNINATGNGLANTLTGNAGNNLLNGLVGADTMIGGLGNDTYTIDATTDVITESLNEGTDLVNVAIATASGSYTVAANVENATLTNTVAYSLIGNALDNVLTGNAVANTLTGAAGNDTLNGLAGNDSMIGGLGNDIYTIDVLTDVVTENLNEGTDLVNVAIATAAGSYTVAANVENASLTNTVAYNLVGNALNNLLIGNGANNILTGGAGADVLTGGLGADTFDFNFITESLVGTSRDIITDFSRTQLDKIDLSTIDANTALANDQAFAATILTAGAFTAAGQLRLVGNILSGNTDSNFATSEFEIQLTGITSVTSVDFIL